MDLIIKAFEKYGLHIFDDIDTCEKLQKKLYEDKKSIINWLVYKQEWYFLALAVMNNNYSINDIVDKFINEFNDIDGTIEELRKRISYDEKVKEILR